MRCILKCIGFPSKAFICFLFLLSIFIFASCISAQNTKKPTLVKGTYVEDEIIVKYKPDYTPQELMIEVDRRKTIKESFLGSFRLFFDNLKYSFNEKEKPEVHLSRIQQLDEELGVIEKTRIYKNSDDPDRNVFLIKTDGSEEVKNMIKKYEELPEVEYAEPNYIFTTQPMP